MAMKLTKTQIGELQDLSVGLEQEWAKLEDITREAQEGNLKGIETPNDAL